MKKKMVVAVIDSGVNKMDGMLQKNIRGELLYQEKNYYVIQSQQNPVTSYINSPLTLLMQLLL